MPGPPIEFAGYVDDFDRTICAMEFSLDDGASWTAYPTAAVDKITWRELAVRLYTGRPPDATS